MYDILELLHLDTKEDAYTYCLKAFMENSVIFREISASQWGFKDSNYKVYRGAFEIPSRTEGNRKRIIPDLVLFNKNNIAVIESKMYSTEGYMQSIDYEQSERVIKGEIDKQCSVNGELAETACVRYYYFTLAGIDAEGSRFESVRWSEYYSRVLKDIIFDNPELEILRKAILKRSIEFNSFISDFYDREYYDMVPKSDSNSWIRPYSLFSAGILDNIWKKKSDEYYIYNGVVNGSGHSTYRTDISPKAYMFKRGKMPYDNICLFSRIEWNEWAVDIYINWEYWLVKDECVWLDYIPYGKLKNDYPILQQLSTDNRKKCLTYLDSVTESEVKNGKAKTINFKVNMLHMVKTSVDIQGKKLGTIIQEIKEIVDSYDVLIRRINEHIIERDGYLTFEI